MHLNASQASILVHRLHERIEIHRDIEIVLAPTFLTIQPLSLQIDRRKFRLAAQNAYWRDEGPYTGEVSFTMLRDLVHYVIVGHSERRHVFNESLEMIRDKTAAAFRNEITPILCVGETGPERQEGETKQVLHDQLMSAFSNLTAEQVGQMVIAYEPVWAISDGSNFKEHLVAKPDQVKEAVDYIRNYVKDVYSERAAKELRILYGGSTVPEVVGGFLKDSKVDGFLVGGASLNYHLFSQIVENTRRWQRQKGDPDA